MGAIFFMKIDLAAFGAVLGTISFFWQVLRSLLADRQAVSLMPEGIELGKAPKKFGTVCCVYPTKLYVKVCNTGRRAIVIDRITVMDVDSTKTIGGKSFRHWSSEDDGHASAKGLKLEVEDF